VNVLNNCCVYCHTSPSSKKYVGISIDPEKRWNSGKGYVSSFRFYRAIKKYGWDSFEHEIIADNLTIEEAESLEKKLIKEWNLTDWRYGYNMRPGADGPLHPETRARMSALRKGRKGNVGFVMPQETKYKVSKSLTEYYKTHDNPMKGKHHSADTIEKIKSKKQNTSEETRKKMRENHNDVSGAKNPSAKPVRQLSIGGETICEYPYAKMAAQKYGLDLSSIIKCCKGKAKSCGGYRWEYK
jgi:group I intron endonuclease